MAEGTERSPDDAAALLAVVAGNLRALREGAGLSLGEVARRAGLSKSTVSLLEAGRANPSIETLWALAAALGVPFGRLVHGGSPAVRVVRAGEGPRIGARDAPVTVRLLASSAHRAAHDLYVMEAEPGPAREAEPHPPGTVEHLTVVAGRMRAGPRGAEVELGPGDYAAFPGDVAHRYETLAPGTRVLLVMEHG